MRLPRCLLRSLLLFAMLALVRKARASDADWHVLTTRHFELYTDLDAQSASDAAKELETTRDALITAAWPAFTFPDVVRTQVFVLRNGLEFERYFHRGLWGLFVPGTRPAFYLYGPPSRWAPRASLLQAAPSSVLRHEMTHQLAAAVFRRAPRWFEEGLAQFLETVQITADGKSIVVGSTNSQARAKFYADRTVTLRRTLEWHEWIADLPQSEVHGLYGTSWALFYWLYNNRQQAFSRYQLALAKGADPKEAWDTAFPGFNPDAYDPVLYEYLRHGQGAVDTLPLIIGAPKIDVKAMSPADAHAVRARIALTGASGAEGDARKARVRDANAELKKALELDPTSVEALLLAASSKSSEDLLGAVRASAKAHPDDSRILRLLGDLLVDRDERLAAYHRALQIDRDDPQTLNALAALLIASHRADEAFPFALRAVKHAPHDSNVISTFAEALFQRGRCQDAIEQQQRAAGRAGESESTAASIVKRLDAMKAACKALGAPSPRTAGMSSVDGNETSVVGASGAEPAPPGPTLRPHDEGIYASASIGLGYGYGSFNSIQGTPKSGSFDGGAFDVEAALGHAITPGFVVGLEAGVLAYPAFFEQMNFDHTAYVSDVVIGRVGIFTDWHPERTLPFHLQAGLDIARGVWDGASGLYNFPQLPVDEATMGYFTYVSAGLVWRVNSYELGPSFRFHSANLGSEHNDATVSGVTALFGFYR